MKTAVEWFIEQLKDMEYDLRLIPNTIEQAKEMEKEQIIEAYNTSFLLRDKPYSTAEKYYKETYESKTRI